MSLDVVVVSFESAAQLPDALAGLPDDARVIVVDNASTDSSAAVARRLGAEVVESAVNAGFGAAVNRGVAHGHGDLVLLLNPDAVVDAATTDELCRRMAEDPGLAVLSPRLVRPDDSPQRARWPFPSAGRAWKEALGLHRLLGDDSSDGFVVGACFLVRRSAFEEVGGFDTRIWLYGEETDLCRRLLAAGWRVELADDLVATHLGGASADSVENLAFEHFERGGEHVVAEADGRTALLSYRLANLVGASIRSIAPGRAERRRLHRSRRRRLLRVLGTHPLSVALDSPAAAADGVGLVVCSLEAWDDVWRRNQFLVRELLALEPDRRVLFVEPPVDVLHELRRGSGLRRRRGLRPVEGEGRIVRFQPVKVWPRVLGAFADRSLRRQVRRAAGELGFVGPRLWVNDAAYAGLATATGWPALYDITDDWTRSGDGGRARARIARAERKLFQECATVVVCSPGLAGTRRDQRPDLVVVPNAVDGDELRRPRPRPDDLPAGPTAVYVGTLHEDRLDVALVEDLAAARPDLAVVLVGPNSLSAASLQRLHGRANVHLLGAREHTSVAAYLQHADMVVVPHVVTPFTESLDPIKAYECLAVGRPTVATPVAGFRGLPDPVQVVEREGFTDAVAAIIDGPRRGDAPQPTAGWDERAAQFDRLLRGAGARVDLDVVFVDHCALLSGGELALVRLIPSLVERGVRARVILGEHGPLEPLLAEAGAEVEVLPLQPATAGTRRHDVRPGTALVRRAVAAVSDVVALRRRLVELEPDLVHTNSLKAALYGGVAARSAGVPVVWHVRDRIADDYLPRPAVQLVRTLARLVPTVVIANSLATRATLGGTLPGGVVPSPVVYDPLPRVEPGDPGGNAPAPFRVALVGRIAPWKGQDVFLRAFATAFAGGPEHAVVAGSAMFGEEVYEESLLRLVDELGIGEQVEFVGFVDDVPGLLASVDCVVHASVVPEPFGQVVVEGMAAGLPVIASAAGGPKEVITDGVDGLLCPPGDVAGLASLLRQVADDRDLRDRLGAAGIRRAEDFRPGKVADTVVGIYRAALSR